MDRTPSPLEMSAIVLNFLSYFLQALVKWKVAKELKDIENEKIATADKHYQAQITKRCFAVFLSYISYRRKKQYVKGKSKPNENSSIKLLFENSSDTALVRFQTKSEIMVKNIE